MEFKKANNESSAFDEFIEQADSQKEKTKNKINDENAYTITAKMTKELKNKIKRKFPTIAIKKFFISSLVMPIEYIDDDVIITIYEQAKWNNTTMADFVRFKLGLIKAPNPQLDETSTLLVVVLKVDKETKDAVKKMARKLMVSVFRYTEIKIQATYELKNLFTFDEIMQLKSEAVNFGFELNEYIKMRIVG